MLGSAKVGPLGAYALLGTVSPIGGLTLRSEAPSFSACWVLPTLGQSRAVGLTVSLNKACSAYAGFYSVTAIMVLVLCDVHVLSDVQ